MKRARPWRDCVLCALAAMVVCDAAPAAGEAGLDIRPARVVRLDGKPERFLACDQPGRSSVPGVALGRQVVSVARALDGDMVSIDPRRCGPPANARPSVQCSMGHGSAALHVDVRLAERARRAGNAIFGERWEYRSLRLRQLSGQNAVSWADHEIDLPPDELFEDRVVRHLRRSGAPATDVCGAGYLVIRSHLQHGAALALYALAPHSRLAASAVSEPLGSPGGWRDVIGVADVMGDGQDRIVEVLEPHRIGRLQLAAIRNDRIEPQAALDGYATHRLGTPRQGIGALLDLTGDGIADIVVPSRDWRCLAVVTAERGRLREAGRLSCAEAPIVDVLAADLDGDGRDDVVAARADGTLEAWMR